MSFSALYADGGHDSSAMVSHAIPTLTVTLPADMKRPAEDADPSQDLVADVTGEERDDPSQPDGLCRTEDELTPDALVISIGEVTLDVPNLDPQMPLTQGYSRSVYGCHGKIYLEQFDIPDA